MLDFGSHRVLRRGDLRSLLQLDRWHVARSVNVSTYFFRGENMNADIGIDLPPNPVEYYAGSSLRLWRAAGHTDAEILDTLTAPHP